jgi:hypothetical protein
MWLRELLETLGYRQPTRTLHCDNQGAIALTQKSSHPRTKHIAIRHHQISEWVDMGMIQLAYTESTAQKADMLTKSLPGPAHAACVRMLNMSRPPTNEGPATCPFTKNEISRGKWNDRSRGGVSACSRSGSVHSTQHRMRNVRRRIYAAHLTVCRGILEQLEQVGIDAFPTAFVTRTPICRLGRGSERSGADPMRFLAGPPS